MRIAVPFEPETGMIAQHFGSAETLRLYTEDDGVVFADDVASPANGAEGVADFLVEQGARIVLCYDLGEGGRDVLFERNIAVLAGLMGKADDAVIALLENRLRYADPCWKTACAMPTLPKRPAAAPAAAAATTTAAAATAARPAATTAAAAVVVNPSHLERPVHHARGVRL